MIEDDFFFPEPFTSEESNEDYVQILEICIWPEVPECEGELADIEYPFTGEFIEDEESTPHYDPFLFTEDDL